MTVKPSHETLWLLSVFAWGVVSIAISTYVIHNLVLPPDPSTTVGIASIFATTFLAGLIWFDVIGTVGLVIRRRRRKKSKTRRRRKK